VGDLNAGGFSPTPDILGFNGFFLSWFVLFVPWFASSMRGDICCFLVGFSLVSLFLTSLDFTLRSLPDSNCLSFRSHHISVSLVFFFPYNLRSSPSSIKCRVMKPRVVFPFVDFPSLGQNMPVPDMEEVKGLEWQQRLSFHGFQGLG